MNDLLADLIVAAKRSPFSRCEWCGWPAYGRACPSCRDLTELLQANQSPQSHHLDVESATTGSELGG